MTFTVTYTRTKNEEPQTFETYEEALEAAKELMEKPDPTKPETWADHGVEPPFKVAVVEYKTLFTKQEAEYDKEEN